MFPAAFADKLKDMGSRDAEFGGKCQFVAAPERIANVAATNFGNLVGSQTRGSMRLAFEMAVFGNFVGLVFDVCSEKQMRRIGVRRIVATMQNAKAICNRAICDFPRYSVSFDVFVFAPNDAIAILVGMRCPNPALAERRMFWTVFVDRLPKALLKSRHNASVGCAVGSPSHVMSDAPSVADSIASAAFNRTRTVVGAWHDIAPSAILGNVNGRPVRFRPFGCTALAAL